eukprot:8847502-Karenia_brevis.AAC.1
MMLGLTDVSLLNDLIFLDHLTDRNHAFCYMTSLLQQLIGKSKPSDCARRMQLPQGMNKIQCWRDLPHNAGDKMNPGNVFTFF